MDTTAFHHQIGPIIGTYLLERGQVHIHKLGMLTLHRRSATLDPSEDKIYPPYYDVEASHLIPTSDLYERHWMDYLSAQLAIEEQEAQMLWQTYCSTAYQALEDGKSWQIEGVGTFDGAPPHHFHQDDQYWGLKVVRSMGLDIQPLPKLRPISAIPEVSAVAEDASAEVADSSLISEDPAATSQVAASSRPDITSTIQPPSSGQGHDGSADDEEKRTRGVMRWWWLLAVMGLIALVAIFILRLDKCQSDPRSVRSVASDSTVAKDTFHEMSSSSTPSTDSSTKTLDASTAIDRPTPDAGLAAGNQPEVASPTTSTTDAKQATVNKKAPYVADDGRCVVIVGAYARRSNRVNMIAQLKNKGYDVYVDSNRHLTRVGVYAGCQNDALKGLLNTMRDEVEPSSWILE